MKNHLKKLVAKKEIAIPVYNFSQHLRTTEAKTIKNTNIVIIEGILILHFKELRDLYTLKIFINTPEKIRYIRRMKRDLNERGRTKKSIEKQYFSSVKQMHKKYVRPSKRHADVIIDGTKTGNDSMDFITSFINSIVL